MEEIKMGSSKESINGIFAQLGSAVEDKPEIFGNTITRSQNGVADWEDALAGSHGLEVNVVEEHLRDLYKLLK